MSMLRRQAWIKMVAADRRAVPVAGEDDDREVRAGPS